MKTVQPMTTGQQLSVFGSSAFSLASHVFGALTCATCWAIFGPALTLFLGSSGTAFFATLRPYAPEALAISALGLAYSGYRLSRIDRSSRKLPFQMAAAFTILSAASWAGSAAYVTITLIRA